MSEEHTINDMPPQILVGQSSKSLFSKLFDQEDSFANEARQAAELAVLSDYIAPDGAESMSDKAIQYGMTTLQSQYLADGNEEGKDFDQDQIKNFMRVTVRSFLDTMCGCLEPCSNASIMRRKQAAFYLYCTTDAEDTVLSIQTGIPLYRLRQWIMDEDWSRVRTDLKTEAMKRAQLSYQEFASRKRTSVVRDQLEAAQDLQNKLVDIVHQIDSDDAGQLSQNTLLLKRIAETFKFVSDIAVRAVGADSSAAAAAAQITINNTNESPVKAGRMVSGISPVMDVEVEDTKD